MVLLTWVMVPAAMAQYSSSKPQYARLEPYGPYQPIYHDWFQEPGGDPAQADDEEAPPVEEEVAYGGADALKVQTTAEHPNFLQPRFSFTQRADMDSDFGNVRGLSTFSGSMELYRRSRKTQLSIEYAGGANLINNGSGTNTNYHQLRLRQLLRGRRWDLMLGSETSYMPEAPFSFVRSGGVFISGTFNINGVSHSFSNAILPIQSLITGRSDRVSNVTVSQLRYRLGGRSSMFVAGSYGMLRFEDSDLTDSNQAQGMLGYERQLSPRNSLGVSYGFTRFTFSNNIPSIKNHTVYATFGRSLTNRMAVRVSGGPQFSMFRDLVTGEQTKVFWSMENTLLYRLSRTNFGLTYYRGLTGGSGALAGSRADLVQLSMSRRLSRVWAMSVNGGYAHNSGIRNFTLASTRASYDSQFGSVTFHRQLGRYRSLAFGYTMSHQNFATPDCTASECQGSSLRHAFHVGFEWDPRPLRLD